MTKFLFPTKNISDNTLKKSIQNQLEEVIREGKEKLYQFKNSDNKIVTQ